MNGPEKQKACGELLPGTIKNKPWGYEKIIVNSGLYVVKELHIKAHQKLSLQYHKKKIETLFLVAGDGFIETKVGDMMHFNRPHTLLPFFIGRNKIHRIGAGEHDALFVEVSSTELDDITRLEDKYGRV